MTLKKFSMTALIFCIGLFIIPDLSADDIPYHQTNGYGTKTEGGLNGAVIRVTNLNNYGTGSLRYALETSGPRIVVFDVAGVINLAMKSITIDDPYITVAGQTAPKPGITLIKGGISIGAHDVVVQHISIRPGSAGQPKRSGWEPDGISTFGENTYNVVIDHCSVTWGVDENLSVSGPGDSDPFESSYDVTLYKCIIAEGLSNSSHSKGEHSKGTLLHDGVTNVSIIGCLYAHNKARNPLFKGNSSAVFVNNVIYNSGKSTIHMADYGTDSGVIIGKSRGAVVGNVWIKGADSDSSPFVESVKSRECGEIYLEDNILVDREGNLLERSDQYLKLTNSPPLWPEGLSAESANSNIYSLLKSVGARAGERDSIDLRIVNSVINGTGEIIDSQNEVGGYPNYNSTERELAVPNNFDERRRWLDTLSAGIDTDDSLDTSALNSLITSINYHKEDDPLDRQVQISNYPNPFNPSTIIRYTLAVDGFVKLIVYDNLGREISMLVNDNKIPGSYDVLWNPRELNLSSGVYFCVIKSGHFSAARKMLFIE